MDLTDVIRTTNACRYYTPDPVPDDALLRVLDAARWGPTGSNKQPIAFIAVKDAGKRRALHDLYQPLWDAIVPRYRSGEAQAGFKPGFIDHVDHFARHLADVPVLVVVACDMTQVTALDANLGRLPLTAGSSVYPAVQNLLLARHAQGLRRIGYGHAKFLQLVLHNTARMGGLFHFHLLEHLSDSRRDRRRTPCRPQT